MAITIQDPTNLRHLDLAYPAELFGDFVDGYAATHGFREDGQEFSAEAFPQAKNHESYNPTRKTWKPTKDEFVRAAILVEAANRAAQGKTILLNEKTAEKNKADSDEVLANGWATLEPVV